MTTKNNSFQDLLNKNAPEVARMVENMKPDTVTERKRLTKYYQKALLDMAVFDRHERQISEAYAKPNSNEKKVSH